MYKIYCIEDINGLKYVGITKQKLHVRLTRHRYSKKTCRNQSSSKLDLDNCEVILLEETNDKKREKYWINKIDCVNYITYTRRDKDIRKEYKKQMYHYQNSWGGRPDKNNNSLLKIDIDYFSS